MTRTHPSGQQGMALIEALIASAVLGIGLVGATQLALKILYTASENRQHTVAQHLAQEAMDCLHARTALCPAQETIEVQGQRYERQTRRTPRDNGRVDDLYVRVAWTASTKRAAAGSVTPEPHHIEWHSSVSSLPGWVGVSSP